MKTVKHLLAMLAALTLFNAGLHGAAAPRPAPRYSKKLPSPPFEAAHPTASGFGYFLEALRSGASVRLRRTHPCAYGSC